MENMKKIIYILLIMQLFLWNFCNAMTRAQVKQAGKLMRNVCQPKLKVTNEQIDNIKTGEFIDHPDVKCYIACIFTVAQTVKNGRLNYESAMKQIDMLMPDDIKDAARNALNECRHLGDKYKNDICEASFEVAKCLYKSSPEAFLFP